MVALCTAVPPHMAIHVHSHMASNAAGERIADGVRVRATVSTIKTRPDYVPEIPTWAELLGFLRVLMGVDMLLTSYSIQWTGGSRSIYGAGAWGRGV